MMYLLHFLYYFLQIFYKIYSFSQKNNTVMSERTYQMHQTVIPVCYAFFLMNTILTPNIAK